MVRPIKTTAGAVVYHTEYLALQDDYLALQAALREALEKWAVRCSPVEVHALSRISELSAQFLDDK